jgi:hypothetical protein
MFANGFLNAPLYNPYAHPNMLTVARAMAPTYSYINSNRPPQNMACRSQLCNETPKFVGNEAVSQSLGTVIITSNEPSVGPNPSVSTGTAKSVK